MLSERFDRALLLASELHRWQKRKGSEVPYVSHLLAVASLVIENGGGEDEAIAALLHDAVEDQGGSATLQRIREDFGERVAQIVEQCSDSDGAEPKREWLERKQEYLSKIAHKSPEARLVSLADKVHNARSILADHQQLGAAVWERFKGKHDGTVWYYQSLVAAFRESGESGWLLQELERLVVEINAIP